jgi:hypothetical protein
MPLPAMSILASDVYFQLALLVPDDESNGYPFAHYIAAMMGPGAEVESWARDTDDGPGWGILLDLDRCPTIALPWLSQCKGVVIPSGMDSSLWRDWIRTAEGLGRGTTAALIVAGQRHLTGTKSVRVIERAGPSVYDYTVIVRPGEVPETDLPLVNEFTNPNFETNTTGWGTTASFRIATAATLTRVTAQFHGGVAALQVVTTAAAVNQGADYPTLTVTSGVPKTVAVWLKGNAGGEALQLILGDGTVGSATATAVLTTAWQRFTVTLTPVASGTTGFAVRQTTASIKTFFMDDALAIARTVAPTYGDGSTAGWVWDGTANASTSHRIPTTIVYADLITAKRIGIRLTLLITDAPLIDDGTRTINAGTAVIDTATLADVT